MTAQVIATGTIAGSSTLCLSLTVVIPGWLDGRGPCRERGDIFFPEDYGLCHTKEIKEAQAVCETCPLREACLEWAIPQADLDGIWGGLTPPQRRRIRVARKKAA